MSEENLRPIFFFVMTIKLSFLDSKLLMKILVQSLRPGNCRLVISHPKTPITLKCCSMFVVFFHFLSLTFKDYIEQLHLHF